MSNSGKLWNIKSYYNLYRQNEVLGNRAVFMGGLSPSESNVIDFVTITTAGDATDFGDLITADQQAGGTANSIRGINLGGRQPAAGGTADCEYITMMSQGNAADFGDSTANRAGSGASNDTTGLYAGGVQFSDRCDQFHHATTGIFVDFGNLANAAAGKLGFGSPIRGFFCAGDAGSPNDRTNTIEHFTFDSAGNGTDFADLSVAMRQGGAANNDTRAIIAHANAPATTALCDVFNFVTGGNASSFGNLTQAREAGINCGSNPTKIVFAGGWTGSANSNVIDSFQFATLGNAVDFGDLTVARQQGSQGQSVSNGHGGLSGQTFQRPSVTYMPGSGRGIVIGGAAPSIVNTMDMCLIPTDGNFSDFGDMTASLQSQAGQSSSTRGIGSAGWTGSANVNTIQSLEMVSQGNMADFGDLTEARRRQSGCSSLTRGVVMGGLNPSRSDVMDYVTIASAGNATDFGNLLGALGDNASCASPTRGISAGGSDPGNSNVIQYITISSTGNATDFGDLTEARRYLSGCSSSTRGVFYCGNQPSASAVIDYITIGSTGNATDFGDPAVTPGADSVGIGLSNNIRGVFGGRAAPDRATVEKVVIATTGNATDFGDLSTGRSAVSGFSDSHGGLQSS